MTEVVSVKFKSRGKTYYFSPNGITIPDNTQVVVETSKGLELADCIYGNHWVEDTRIVPPLRPVIRIATTDDLRVAELCKAREKEAFAICEEKIEKHGLDMKLVDVECNFEGNKILFFFISDGRVDFRELVKDLASVFRTRIELRQIGVRDEAKMLGGLGICGRPFCCHQFLDDFQPVSTKMAKTQSLSLNPTKISGTCGRLMCCLRYEQEAYEDLSKTVPKNGAFVETPEGYGNVTQVSLLRQKVKVKLDDDNESLHTYDAEDVATVPGGRPKPGTPLPHVLKPRVKKVEEEEAAVPTWMPPVFAEETAKQEEEKGEEAQEKKHSSRNNRNRRRKKGGEKSEKQEENVQKAPAAQNTEKNPQQKTTHPQQKKRSGNGQNAPKQDAPKAKPAEHKSTAEGGEGAKKRSNNHRRRYYRKPKSGGGQKSE
ncbi:MAG: hypothetical protein IKV47_08005 [Oscillospiraceae bacterium]|nr:hypothetical protein [Oscillospiraceae bacterium]